MKRPPFDRVVIAAEARQRPFTGELLDRLGGAQPITWAAPGAPPPRGRRTLYVAHEHGAFLRPCPCSPGVVGCGYWVISPVFQCPYACSYCFLRFYAPDAPLTVYANLEDAAAELRATAATWSGPVRLGTGEFADSLALDPWTGHARWLSELVAARPEVVLELKTKSAEVDGLLAAGIPPNVVVAWSVNPPRRVVDEEAGTACLEERLAAARRVVDAGGRVAFHFDPILVDGAWQDDYRHLARALFAAVPAERIAWISLGTLRFPQAFLQQWGPQLRSHPLYFAEFVRGSDGKLRYFWPLRRQVYQVLNAELRRLGGAELRIYLCMEPPGMWRAGLGWIPEEAQLARYLGDPASGFLGSPVDGAAVSPVGR